MDGIDELVVDLTSVLIHASNTLATRSHLLKDVGEIINVASSVSRTVYGASLTRYRLYAAGFEEIGDDTEETLSAAHLELLGLRSLCEYDTKHGAVYALRWTAILNRISHESFKQNALAEQRTYWLILEQIGRTLFELRRPKHFEYGLSQHSMEIVLLASRTVAVLTTPLAVSIAAPSDKTWTGYPDYLSATRLIRKAIFEELNSLASLPLQTKGGMIFQDFSNWLFLTNLNGRGIEHLGPRTTAGPEGETQPLILEGLKQFDSMCGSSFEDCGRTFLLRLSDFVRNC